MATEVWNLPSGKTNSPPSYLPPEEANAVGDTETALTVLAELLGATVRDQDDFTGAIVAGCLYVQISAGVGFPLFASGRRGVRRTTAATTLIGLTALSTNYVYLMQDLQVDATYFKSNTSGVAPEGSTLLLTCITDATEVTSITQQPTGRRHFGDAILGSRRWREEPTEVDITGVIDVTLAPDQYDTGLLKLTGVLGADIDVIAPDETGRGLWVWNATTGGFTPSWKPTTKTAAPLPPGLSYVHQTAAEAVVLVPSITGNPLSLPGVTIVGAYISPLAAGDNLVLRGKGATGVIFNLGDGTGGVTWYDGAAGVIAALTSAGFFTTVDVGVAAAGAYYFGDSVTNTSWRITRSGDNLVMERREAGVWVTKFTLTTGAFLMSLALQKDTIAAGESIIIPAGYTGRVLGPYEIAGSLEIAGRLEVS